MLSQVGINEIQEQNKNVKKEKSIKSRCQLTTVTQVAINVTCRKALR